MSALGHPLDSAKTYPTGVEVKMQLSKLCLYQHTLRVENRLLRLKTLEEALCVITGRWDPVRA